MNAVENMAVGYDADFHDWVAHQARLLREGRLDEVDRDHLAEEVEDLGRELLFAVQSWATQILAHLACLRFSPASEPASHWKGEIVAFRIDLAKRLRASPSLRRKLAEGFDDLWRDARKLALHKMRRDAVEHLPADCPFTLAQVLDENFFAESG